MHGEGMVVMVVVPVCMYIFACPYIEYVIYMLSNNKSKRSQVKLTICTL